AELSEFTGRPDALGRMMPRRVPVSTYIEIALRSQPGRLREVPRAAVEEDGHDDDGPFAMVRCPCGHQPVARYEIAKCSGCERYYVACGPKTFVLYGAMDLPQKSATTDADDASS